MRNGLPIEVPGQRNIGLTGPIKYTTVTLLPYAEHLEGERQLDVRKLELGRPRHTLRQWRLLSGKPSRIEPSKIKTNTVCVSRVLQQTNQLNIPCNVANQNTRLNAETYLLAPHSLSP